MKEEEIRKKYQRENESDARGTNVKAMDKFVQFKDCFFMHNFKAYQISEDTDMLVAAHEFGHAILSIMNHTVVPKDYNEIITRAKQHAVSPENREDFREYIQYLSGKTEEKEHRTKAEKGPVSDIISSIF